MSKSKKGLLPRIEILIVLVFFLSFIIWAASKCNSTKLSYQEEDQVETADTPDTTSTTQATAGDTTGSVASPQEGTNPAGTSPNASDTKPGSAATSANGTKLFVTIDGLNMRTEPRLDAAILDKLRLNDEVWFMNEVTDTTQQINLGKEITDEPWVKVKNKKGKTGWVYGAGVHYYPLKHPGTLE